MMSARVLTGVLANVREGLRENACTDPFWPARDKPTRTVYTYVHIYTITMRFTCA